MDKDYYQDEPIPPNWRGCSEELFNRTGYDAHDTEKIEPNEGKQPSHCLWDRIPPDRTNINDDSFTNFFNNNNSSINTEDVDIDDDVPEKIKRFFLDNRNRPDYESAYSFYKDAVQLVDVEDCFEIVPFSISFPTYRLMTLSQLRSYFTFRANFRKGVYLDVPSCYIYVYIYEALMLVGVQNAEEGWQLLTEVSQVYNDKEHTKLRYNLNLWMKDYVVYYGLHEYIDEVFADEKAQDATAETLLNLQQIDDNAVWTLVPKLDDYKLDSCLKKVGDIELIQRSVSKALKQLDMYYRSINEKGLLERYCGHLYRETYPLFFSARFYQPVPRRNYSFKVDNVYRYVCEERLWYVEHYRFYKQGAGQNSFKKMLHEIDRELRLQVTGKAQLKSMELTDEEHHIISNSIAQTIQELAATRAKAEHEAVLESIKIDTTKLSSIRTDADITKEQLLNDEERGITNADTFGVTEKSISATSQGRNGCEENRSLLPDITQPAAAAIAKDSLSHSSLLLPLENELLHRLLASQDWKFFLKENHLILSVIMESINNKLYSVVGDIVLQEGDNGPEIIEDYKEDITQILHQEE